MCGCDNLLSVIKIRDREEIASRISKKFRIGFEPLVQEKGKID
jgi:hypothetical protein